MIVEGAGAAIVASVGVVREGASRGRIAAVVRAGVAVFTECGVPAPTAAPLAMVVDGTGISIVASVGVVREGAACREVAVVVCAGVSVLTGGGASPAASAALAVVVVRAGIPIVADVGVVREGAACRGIAAILRAGISVITGEEIEPNARAPRAAVSRGACAPVITGSVVVGERAPFEVHAGTARAEVVVLADEEAHPSADSFSTVVGGGAGIAVITGEFCDVVAAACERVTGVDGADVSVVAIG
jgi:hypothetical protein